ncbi:MAG: peptidoglycan bridge formation glycyltransferase FemA/FemB family protein [Candidatus Peregrinibacteria bacterium]|nr:peptidoglycan bridge formation glycyltransferase FemA/FemB family protein [Candidatus Peregrinibacteria bacterium]
MSTPTPLHFWNDFVKLQPLGSLYQTSVWEHFQKQIPGKGKSWMCIVTDPKKNNHILGGGLIILHSLPFNLSWLECPRGPVFDVTHASAFSPSELEYFFQNFLEQVQEIADANRAVFLRMDPPMTTSNISLVEGYNNLTEKLQFKPAHASYFPQTTLTIDLTQTPEEILKQMKSKGRYNIKLAEKHGITIERINTRTNKEAIVQFYNLIEQTAKRDNFFAHNLAYYESMLEALGESATLFMAYNKQKPVAGLIATYFADTTTYYYGASSYSDRPLMAPYLLQWHVMLDARSQGYKTYDLLGIANIDQKTGTPDTSHPLAGVTDFKTKFGGTILSYLPAKELVYMPIWYWIIKMRKRLRG